MTDSSVNKIVEFLQEQDLLDENYTNIKNDLLVYRKSIYVENIISNIKKLSKYFSGLKLKNVLDIPFLTLSNEEADKFSLKFEELGENIKLRTLRDFKENPEDIIKRVRFCQQYEIPYCTDDGVLFQEIASEMDSSLYLRGYYLKQFQNNGLNDNEIEKFIKVCSMLQQLSFKNIKQKLFINREIENEIKTYIKNNPSLSEDDIVTIFIENHPEFQFLKNSEFKTYDEENNSRNGRR